MGSPNVLSVNGNMATFDTPNGPQDVDWTQVRDPQIRAAVTSFQLGQMGAPPMPEQPGPDVAAGASALRNMLSPYGEQVAGRAPAPPAPPPGPRAPTAFDQFQGAPLPPVPGAPVPPPVRRTRNVVGLGPSTPAPQQPTAPVPMGARRARAAQAPVPAAQAPETDQQFLDRLQSSPRRDVVDQTAPPAPMTDRLRRQLDTMPGMSPYERQQLLAPLSATEARIETIRAQQKAEREQMNAVASADIDMRLRQQEAQDAREEQADAMRRFEDQLEKDRAGLTVDNYWKDKGTGARIAAAIAVGLGAFGSAFTHGPNFALEIINGNIEKDLALKREALNKREERAVRERARFASDQEYLDAQAINSYQAAIQQAQTLGQGARDAAAQQSIAELTSQLQAQQGSILQQVYERNQAAAAAAARARALANEPRIQVEYGNGLREWIPASDWQRIRGAAKILDARQGNNAPFTPPASTRVVGQIPQGLNEADQRKIRERAAAAERVTRGIDRLAQLREEAGNGEIVDRELVRRINSARTSLLLGIKNAEEMGALDKGALEVGERLIPDPTDFTPSQWLPGFDDPIRSGLNELRRTTVENANAGLRQYGLEFSEQREQTRSLFEPEAPAEQAPSGGR